MSSNIDFGQWVRLNFDPYCHD